MYSDYIDSFSRLLALLIILFGLFLDDCLLRAAAVYVGSPTWPGDTRLLSPRCGLVNWSGSWSFGDVPARSIF